MKNQKITLVAALIISSIFTFSASATSYQEIMQENIENMYKANTAKELSNISVMFYRVSEKEQDQWLPLYYASYSLVRIAFFVKVGDEIDAYLDVAQEYMDVLLKTKSEESEVHVLQALIYSMRITNAARGMKYSVLSNSSLDTAEQLNKLNPRIYYCKGNNVFHTPSFFGGGKDNAKPLFEKAAELFKNKSSEVAFWPTWGQVHNQQMLAKCAE